MSRPPDPTLRAAFVQTLYGPPGERVGLSAVPGPAPRWARGTWAIVTAWNPAAQQAPAAANHAAQERLRGLIAGAGLTLLHWGPTRGDPQPWRGRIVNVWTHPDHRRLGLARHLVRRCLEAACERGVTRLSLGTTAEARSLYETLGFTASTAEMTLTLR